MGSPAKSDKPTGITGFLSIPSPFMSSGEGPTKALHYPERFVILDSR
jgi:hypothetical protein